MRSGRYSATYAARIPKGARAHGGLQKAGRSVGKMEIADWLNRSSSANQPSKMRRKKPTDMYDENGFFHIFDPGTWFSHILDPETWIFHIFSTGHVAQNPVGRERPTPLWNSCGPGSRKALAMVESRTFSSTMRYRCQDVCSCLQLCFARQTGMAMPLSVWQQ